jgi:hypothetical protein
MTRLAIVAFLGLMWGGVCAILVRLTPVLVRLVQ